MNDYIIVGGGIGGLYFIDKLLDKGAVGNILLVEKTYATFWRMKADVPGFIRF